MTNGYHAKKYPDALSEIHLYRMQIMIFQPISCHWSLLIPPKTSENYRFSDVFRGYQKRSMAWNGLNGLLAKSSDKFTVI